MAFYEDPRKFNKEHSNFPFCSHREIYNGKGMTFSAHYHEMIEFQYINEGEIYFYLGNNLIVAQKGDMVIINSGEIHSGAKCSENTDITVVQFDRNFLHSSDKTSSKIKYIWPFLYLSNDNPRIIKNGCVKGCCLGSLMNDIYYHCKTMEYGFDLLVKADIYTMFYHILMYLKSIGKVSDIYDEPQDGSIKVIDEVLEFVKENYGKNITAKDGAKTANLSYSYFSRLFNSVMGMGFSEYLTSVRLARSEQLLVDSDKTITEIAYECGFSTSSYFIMKFKEKNGIPPLGFRKKFGLMNNK